RTVPITGTFIETKKPYIDNLKPDIDDLKPDCEVVFRPKTVSHILKMREAFPGQTIFGRSDIMQAIDNKASRASDFLKEMVGYGVSERVTGHGKGKYQFRHH